MRVLRCSCCGLPFAVLQNGALVVQSQHSGNKHTNAISLAELARLARDESAIAETIERQVRTISA